MTALVICKGVSKSYGQGPLFEGLDLSIHRHDKLAIVGPNGSGKTTLLGLVAGLDQPDEGSVTRQSALRVAFVPQSSRHGPVACRQVVIDALLRSGLCHDEVEAEVAALTALSRLGFTDYDKAADTLSGGWRKRLDIATALAQRPALLLLDEPTNHLDFEGLELVEALLQRWEGALCMVSHDRHFLQKIPNRIVEINPRLPGRCLAVAGNWDAFCRQRHEQREALLSRKDGLESRLRREQQWVRESPRARTTKQQARLDAYDELTALYDEIKQQTAQQRRQWAFAQGDLQARKLIAAKGLCASRGGRRLFSGVDFVLTPQTRLAIVGDNGAGKTTLLKILNGELKADGGVIKKAEGLSVVYFDQQREQIDDSDTLAEALGQGKEFVQFNGKEVHVVGWAKMFNFDKSRLTLPVAQLSGGERARLLLSRLMLKKADVLLLDEPSNDLDIESLQLLEESIACFEGAVVFITHDRYMIESMASAVLALGGGLEQQLYADFGQWRSAVQKLKERHRLPAEQPAPLRGAAEGAAAKAAPPKKLAWSEQQALQQLPGQIEEMEQRLAALSLVAQTPQQYNEMAALQRQIDALYRQWEELEQKAK